MLDQRRIDLSKQRLDYAKDDLEDAEKLYSLERYRSANNRIYYAVFHAIRSVLALDCVDFKKHSGVISYFHKNYINTDLVNHSFSDLIKNVIESRNNSDYTDFYIATVEEVENNIKGTKEFLFTIDRLIEVRLEAEADIYASKEQSSHDFDKHNYEAEIDEDEDELAR